MLSRTFWTVHHFTGMRGKKCMSGTNGPKIDESFSYADSYSGSYASHPFTQGDEEDSFS